MSMREKILEDAKAFTSKLLASASNLGTPAGFSDVAKEVICDMEAHATHDATRAVENTQHGKAVKEANAT